ncbi:helix-hairpin-helix domain-containing protein [Paenarthrobacter sp. NPDC090522]|uniref:helix-hairpin-helix domain-containing protein n=1 Tax=Paenarthrobacter sp. NPDC090522 TaxID=3364383 RepID=UPI0037F45151
MPRRTQDASSDAATAVFRRRLSRHVQPAVQAEPLLAIAVEEQTSDGGDSAGLPTAVPSRFRWRSPRAVVFVVAAAAVVAAVCFVWQTGQDQPLIEPLTPAATSEAAVPGAEAGQVTMPGATVVIHIAGAVQKPGVVSLPEGSRVFQAIDAAGGAAQDARLDGLNLAEVVADGAKIVVPRAGDAPVPSPVQEQSEAEAGSAAGPGSSAKVNINTASVEELGTLPRVGPVMAQRIADWRKDHGPFTSVEELDAIDGIGPKLMESLKGLVTVQGG